MQMTTRVFRPRMALAATLLFLGGAGAVAGPYRPAPGAGAAGTVIVLPDASGPWGMGYDQPGALRATEMSSQGGRWSDAQLDVAATCLPAVEDAARAGLRLNRLEEFEYIEAEGALHRAGGWLEDGSAFRCTVRGREVVAIELP